MDNNPVNNLERLIVDFKESLERQIQQLSDRMDKRFDEMNTKFDSQATRLDRHAGLLQAGSRWTSRMNTWAERIDSALTVKDREIAELHERISRIERKIN